MNTKGFAPIIIILALAVIIGGGTFAVVKRDALKDFFQTGDKPTQDQFKDLIDSDLNLSDDQKLADSRDGDSNFNIDQPTGAKTFKGMIYLGSSAEIGKSYCAEGLYLKLESGAEILLRDSKKQMFADKSYVGKRVNITGIYPTENTMRCEALICGCEEYLIAEKIEILN